MDRSEARKFQVSQLLLLEYLDKVCRDNKLTYYLVFGSLVGAIRHEGYIPWDVDIDVAMFRRDYELLRKVLHEQPNPFLYYEHYENEKYHISPHALLRIKGTHVIFPNYSLVNHVPQNDGIYIDIFPIDNIIDPDVSEMKQVRKISLLRRLVYYKTALSFKKDHSILKKIGKIAFSILLSPIKYEYLNAKTDSIMQQYNNIETEYVGILTDPDDYRRQIYPRNIFGNGRECAFEGHRFLVPEKAEEFLSIRYGDYMQLPPENERWERIDNQIESVDYGTTRFLEKVNEYLE